MIGRRKARPRLFELTDTQAVALGGIHRMLFDGVNELQVTVEPLTVSWPADGPQPSWETCVVLTAFGWTLPNHAAGA